MFDASETYDIFLSHSYKDATVVLGTRDIIRDLGFSVYVDWIEDPQLDRTSVTAETAQVLRERMRSCRSLLYAASEKSTESRWMPWECGYADGLKGRCAILPLTEEPEDGFRGKEYMGLYPYVVRDPERTSGEMMLWVHRNRLYYVDFASWLEGKKPRRHLDG